MYADVDARGGILEPPGIVEVKYRAHQQAGRRDSVGPLGAFADLAGIMGPYGTLFFAFSFLGKYRFYFLGVP